MRKELRAQIIAYNTSVKEQRDKADDLDVILAEISKLPPGHLKKVLTANVLAVLKKYGVNTE